MKDIVMKDIVMLDLGNVLYHINLQRTHDSLALLAGREVEFSLTSQAPVFDLFECGLLSADGFRAGLREAYALTCSDDDITDAWNALLVGLDPRSTAWVRALKEHHRVILLSNINVIHHERIAAECAELFSLFDALYLSYDIGLRKPSPRIFRHVLDREQVTADRIRYFDDAPQHVDSALRLGFDARRVLAIDDLPGMLGV
ncbi:MAG: HAD family hydrolase [Candidatus Kapaibacterium sp.]